MVINSNDDNIWFRHKLSKFGLVDFIDDTTCLVLYFIDSVEMKGIVHLCGIRTQNVKSWKKHCKASFVLPTKALLTDKNNKATKEKTKLGPLKVNRAPLIIIVHERLSDPYVYYSSVYYNAREYVMIPPYSHWNVSRFNQVLVSSQRRKISTI